MTGPRVAVAVSSALVLTLTGYYWSTLSDWQSLSTADVIGAGAGGDKPADGAIDILMVGMDSRTDAQGNPLPKEKLAELSAGGSDGELNTDTLIMVRIPNDGGRAVGVSIPRDSYVDIPGHGKHKINSAYTRAKTPAMDRLAEQGVDNRADLEVRSNQEGAKSLIATVQKLTGATIDHYAEVNLLGFYDITKAVGGIDVCLNHRVDDDYSGAHFDKGRQNLSGAAALAFVRQRHGLPNGDLDRIVRQQVFMSGMAKKVLSAKMLAPGSSALDELHGAVERSVVLDRDWNVLEFAQQMQGFTGGNLEFHTIPVGDLGLQTSEDGQAVEVDPRAVKEFVSGLLGGTTPRSSGADPTAAAKPVTVDVRNASGRTGLAALVSKSLAAQGFTVGDTGNAAARTRTVVRHAPDQQDVGERVAGAVGGEPAVEPDANLGDDRAVVLLGSDYRLPAADSGNRLSGQGPVNLRPANGHQPTSTAPVDTSGCVN